MEGIDEWRIDRIERKVGGRVKIGRYKKWGRKCVEKEEVFVYFYWFFCVLRVWL